MTLNARYDEKINKNNNDVKWPLLLNKNKNKNTVFGLVYITQKVFRDFQTFHMARLPSTKAPATLTREAKELAVAKAISDRAKLAQIKADAKEAERKKNEALEARRVLNRAEQKAYNEMCEREFEEDKNSSDKNSSESWYPESPTYNSDNEPSESWGPPGDHPDLQ